MPEGNDYWSYPPTSAGQQYAQPRPGQAQAAQATQPQAQQAAQAQNQHQAQQAAQAQVAQPQAQQPQQAQYAQPQAQQAAQPQAQQAAQFQSAPAYAAPSGLPQGYPQPAVAPTAAQQAAQAAPKKGKGWVVAIVAIVCFCALTAFGVKSCADSMDSLATMGEGASSSLAGLEKDAVAVLELTGTIQYDGSACSPEGFKELLDEAQENEHVKALVLRVNSGGGTATAGEEMAEYLRQFDKPVVVSSASINASAAYEISAQADYIFVAKSTEIGAIGTAMEVTDLSGLFDKLGVNMETITSADSKDSTYGYRPLTDEERAYYQDMVDQINDMFVENVAAGRKMDVEKARELATGLTFTGVDAVANGLADEIGTREDAVKKAAELAGIEDYTTADLEFSSYDLGNLAYLFGESKVSVDDLVSALEAVRDSRVG